MIKELVLLLFFVSICTASKQLSKYNFKNDLEALKNLLTLNEDIRPVLNSFNSDTHQLFTSPNAPSPRTIREYIAIKEEIICLLLNNSFTNFHFVELRPFNETLVEEILRYESYFKKENLHLVLIFLFKTSCGKNVEYARKIGTKLLINFNHEQMNVFVDSGVLKLDGTETELDKRIKELSSSSSDPEEVFSIFTQIFNEKSKISCSLEESLADLLKILDLNLHPEWLIPILETLKYFYLNGTKSKIFTSCVTKFILSENVLHILRDMEINENYSFLIYFASKESQEFKDELESLSIEMRNEFCPYEYFLSLSNKVHKMFQWFRGLTDDSDEIAFKLAISGFTKILVLKYESEFIRNILKLEYDLIKKVMGNFSEVYNDSLHPLNHFAWKVAGCAGFLFHDVVENESSRNSCFTNIASGFGHALLKEDLTTFSKSIISMDHLYSIIGLAAEYTLKDIKEFMLPFKFSHLKAIIKFIELHPSIEERNSYISQFCAQYISDVPAQFNKYYTIDSIQIITERRDIYVSGFLTFLKNYTSNPSESKLPYLREFYSFLKDSNLLSKTELIILENKFKGFTKLLKK